VIFEDLYFYAISRRGAKEHKWNSNPVITEKPMVFYLEYIENNVWKNKLKI
jgi:hypothetical protein